MRLISVLAMFLAAITLVQVCPAQAPAADVDTLVCRWFDAETDSDRAAALKAIKDRKDITIQQVEDAVRRGVFYKPQESGTSTRKITVEFNKGETDCTFYVPPGYDPKKSYPALLTMPGHETGRQFIDRWMPYVTHRNMILIAPTQINGVDGPSGVRYGKDTGYGAHEDERSVPISAIHAARRLYNIDSDRLYMTGVSLGGHCAWDSILTRSDYFAGGIIEAGVPMVEGFQLARQYFLPNLFQVRMWVMQGTPDKDQPKLNTQATDKLRSMGFAVEYRQYEGKGHGKYPEESDKALDFVTAGARDVYCQKVMKVDHRVIHGRAYWVRIDKLQHLEWDPRAQIQLHVDGPISKEETAARVDKFIQSQLGRIDAEVKPGNIIKVTTRDVSDFTIFLHDKLVDMDKPVNIYVNGRGYVKTVKRDVGVLLEEVRKGWDTKRTYYGSVSLKAY